MPNQLNSDRRWLKLHSFLFIFLFLILSIPEVLCGEGIKNKSVFPWERRIRWRNIKHDSKLPFPRYQNAGVRNFVFASSSKYSGIFNFGGFVFPSSYECKTSTVQNLNSVNYFDLSERKWTLLNNGSADPDSYLDSWPSSSTFSDANFPCGRSTSIAFDDDTERIVLFGGARFDRLEQYCDASHNVLNSTWHIQTMSDLWVFDAVLNQWAYIGGSSGVNSEGNYGEIGVSSSSFVPPSRMGSLSYWFAGKFYLFGGSSPDYTISNTSSSKSVAVNHYRDIWRFDPDSHEFAWIGGANVPLSSRDAAFDVANYGRLREDDFSLTGPGGRFNFFGSNAGVFLRKEKVLIFLDVHPGLGYNQRTETANVGHEDFVSFSFFNVETELFLDNISLNFTLPTFVRKELDYHTSEVTHSYNVSRTECKWFVTDMTVDAFDYTASCLGHTAFVFLDEENPGTVYFSTQSILRGYDRYTEIYSDWWKPYVFHIDFGDWSFLRKTETTVLQKQPSEVREITGGITGAVTDTQLLRWIDSNFAVGHQGLVFKASYVDYVGGDVVLVLVAIWFLLFCAGMIGGIVCGVLPFFQPKEGGKVFFKVATLAQKIVIFGAGLAGKLTKMALMVYFAANGDSAGVLITIALAHCLETALYYLETFRDCIILQETFGEKKEKGEKKKKTYCDTAEEWTEDTDIIEEFFYLNDVFESMIDPIIFLCLVYFGNSLDLVTLVILDVVLTLFTLDNTLFGAFPEVSKALITRVLCCKDYRKFNLVKFRSVVNYAFLLITFVCCLYMSIMAIVSIAHINSASFYADGPSDAFWYSLVPVFITLAFSTVVTFHSAFERMFIAPLLWGVLGVVIMLLCLNDMGISFASTESLSNFFMYFAILASVFMWGLFFIGVCTQLNGVYRIRKAIMGNDTKSIVKMEMREKELETISLLLEDEDDD